MTGTAVEALTAELVALLADAVAHGASVGFLSPLDDAEAAAYWRKVAGEVAAGQTLLWIARDQAGRIAGSAQLALEGRANGRHRAEVRKVMVFAALRGRGLGARLMEAVEGEARRRGLRLLFLDTSVGAAGACEFYRALGWSYAGGIPEYAANPDGTRVANAIFYKLL